MSEASPKRPPTFRILNSAKMIARAHWDALARRGYHRHAWFVAAEACGADARHVGVYEGAELIAVIPAYIERETLHGDLHARWYGPARHVAGAIGASLRPSLAIGAPMSTGSDPLGPDDVLTEDVIESALELLEAEARAERLKAVVWPFVDESSAAARAVAARRGYRESFANSEAVLDVVWKSPEEYLAAQSKNVRRTLKNEIAWVYDEGIRISWETEFSDLVPTFDAFYRASYLARNGRPTNLSPSFFTELASQLSPRVHVQCAWRRDELLEMAVALDGGGELDLCLSAQSDETRNGLLYQHLLCYDPVRFAITNGLHRIHLGPSALFPKVLRGAKLRTRLSLVLGCTPPARAAVSVLAPVTNARNRAKQKRQLGTLSPDVKAR